MNIVIMDKSGEKWGKGVENMFLGEYRHALDEKGRLFIPAKLRESLGKHFYVSIAFSYMMKPSGLSFPPS